MKRLFIIHGWGGFPEEGWFPWLKKEAEARGFKVEVPAMPNSDKPEISTWISHLKEKIGEIDEETYLVGHSIGCQTILRYLEDLDENKKVGGVVLVAGFIHLKLFEEEEEKAIAKPWLETPIDWDKIKKHTDKFISIFSDNDPFVPVEDSKIFKEKLNSKIIIEHEKGHFSGPSDNTTELPIALDSLLEISK